MELNDRHSKLAKQEEDIEGLESEAEVVIPSGDETDSSSESGWDVPELTEEDFHFIPDPANPFLAELAALIEQITRP
jgi:hypothetical protein